MTKEEINNIKKQYPKSYEHLKAYVLSQIQKLSVGSFNPSDLNKIPLDVLDMSIEQMLGSNNGIRSLYSFFDENIIICCPYQINTWWDIKINEVDYSIGSHTRIQAENEGFKMCFSELEKKLSV